MLKSYIRDHNKLLLNYYQQLHRMQNKLRLLNNSKPASQNAQELHYSITSYYSTKQNESINNHHKLKKQALPLIGRVQAKSRYQILIARALLVHCFSRFGSQNPKHIIMNNFTIQSKQIIIAIGSYRS